jgi:hypothetical protein
MTEQGGQTDFKHAAAWAAWAPEASSRHRQLVRVRAQFYGGRRRRLRRKFTVSGSNLNQQFYALQVRVKIDKRQVKVLLYIVSRQLKAQPGGD